MATNVNHLSIVDPSNVGGQPGTTRLLTAVSGRYNNTVAFQYGDGAGRRTSEALTVNLGQARTYTVGSQYDVVGRLVRIVYPDGGLVDRSYTDRNQLFEVKSQNALVARFTSS